MHVPRSWVKASGVAEAPDGSPQPLAVWGFGDDEAEARSSAAQRLARLIERLRSGDPGTDEYGGYGARPLREEILETLGPGAVLTRCRYGAVILNAASLLFLDVDLPEEGGMQRLGRLFSKADPAAAAVERLRAALREAAPATTFRLYRTAAGLRALAVDREFDPVGPEAQALMERTGADPDFARLCRVQKSFRARLTPKPWRMGCPNPTSEYPRTDRVQKRFDDWRKRYDRAMEKHATCRYVESVGSGAPLARLQPLIQLHDRVTRCAEKLPLA